jgi:hypothetical protein
VRRERKIMTINHRIIHLMAIALVLSLPAMVAAQRSKVIEIVAIDGGPKTMSMYLNDQNLLIKTDKRDSILFTADAVFNINHREKTYSVQTYDEIQTMLSQQLDKIAKPQDGMGISRDKKLTLSAGTETISGLRTRKLTFMDEEKSKSEIWVSSDLVPGKLKAAGERMRSLLPDDFWSKAGVNAGWVEIIILYGIPLKTIDNEHKVYQARVRKSRIPRALFQVPSGYSKVGG